MQTDFANLKPLKAGGAMGFSKFRDPKHRSASLGDTKGTSGREDSDMESDGEDETKEKTAKGEDTELPDTSNSTLSPDDARRQGELAEGVQKIRVIRGSP